MQWKEMNGVKKRVLVIACSCLLSATVAADGPKRVADADYDWIDVSELDIGGRGYFSVDEPFVRFPKLQREKAPGAVREMSRESTGLNFRFKTTSKKLVFRYVTEKRSWADPLIPPSGLQSVSIWGQWEGSRDWEYVSKNHPRQDGDNEYVIGWNPGRTGWLYFPMRSVVKKFSIGIERGAKFETVPFPDPGKIVIYGTSIVHGGCVSSGGMMFTSFLGRKLDRDIVNLGFSGGGRMESEMADLISEIEASLYVIDCDWNMSVEMQKERYETFLRRLRRLRPATPILLCGGCTEKKVPRAQEKFARSVYEKLKAEKTAKWDNLYFLSGVDALPKCTWATHDHCHPNDFGAPFMGDVYARRIGEILASDRRTASEIQAESLLNESLRMLGADMPDREFVFGRPKGGAKPKANESIYMVDDRKVFFWGDDSGKKTLTRYGTLSAVSLFLEKELGFRWLWAGEDGTVVGRKKLVKSRKPRIGRYVPPLQMSRLRNPDGSKSYWTQRYLKSTLEGLKVSNRQLHEEHLQRRRWLRAHRHQDREHLRYGHAFTDWHSRFAKTNPEYLGLNAKTGERGFHAPRHPATVKLCVSNEAVVDQIIADWKARGAWKILNVCENDGAFYCECDKCRALDVPGSTANGKLHYADRYLDFWNRVAEKALRICPDLILVTYAYSNYREPPRRVRVKYPDNMVFGFVPGTMEDSRPMFEGWRAKGLRKMFLRPNHTCYGGAIPRGLERFLYDEFHYYLKNGMVGVDYDSTTGMKSLRLECYMLARMIAAPHMSFDDICAEFYSGFGAAAADVKAYYEMVRKRGEEQRMFCLKGVQPYAGRFTDCSETVPFALNCTEERLQAEKAVLDRALASGKARGAALERLKELRLCAEHAVLTFRVYKASKFGLNMFHKTFTPVERDLFNRVATDLLDYRIKNLRPLGDNFTFICGYPWGEGMIWGKSSRWWELKKATAEKQIRK